MTLSEFMARKTLEKKKDDLDLNDLGFITTVLRDNELDDQLHDYYNAVLKLISTHMD